MHSLKRQIWKVLLAAGITVLVAAAGVGLAFVSGSQAATSASKASGQPAQMPMSQVDANNLPSAAGKTNVPAPSFPAASGIICPSSISPPLTAPSVKGTSAASMAEVQDQLSAFETSVKGAASATPDKRTSALATCNFAPAIYFNPKNVTINTGQTFQFTLEVFYAEYGCDLSWAGHVATDSSGHFPANQSGAVTYTSPSWGSAGTYYLTVSCGGLGGTNVDQIVVTVLSSGGGTGSNPCDQQSTSQLWATFISGTINTTTPMKYGTTLNVTAGASLQYHMVIQNDGACPWNAAMGIRDGSTNPDNNLNLGTSRIYLPSTANITTGQRWTIDTFFNAPTTAGCYTVGWRTLRDYVVWFGSQTNDSEMTICVTGSVQPPPTTTTTTTTTTTPTPPQYPVLYRGKMVDANGSPVVGTVQASVYLNGGGNPQNEVSLAVAQTDSAGNFTLRPDPNDQQVQQAMQDANTYNGSWLSVNIFATSSTVVVPTVIARRWTGSSWASNSPGSPGTDGMAMRTFMMAKSSPGAISVPKALSRRLQRAQGGPSCYAQTTVLSTTPANVIIGNLHTTNMTGTFTYGTRSDSDIGVGVSSDGINWKSSGSVHVSNTVSSQVTVRAGNEFGYRIVSPFDFQKTKTVCVGIPGLPPSYKVKVKQWRGGYTLGANVHHLDHQCNTTYAANRVPMGVGSFKRTSSRATNYKAGVTVFGFTLSAKSGYSTSVAATWNFSVPGVLCGTDGPPTTATTVLAG
jgi:hypothetical protein